MPRAQARALLSCIVPLPSQWGPEWPLESRGEVDKVHGREMFHSLAWLFERLKGVSERFQSWKSVDGLDRSNCERCAPTPPKIQYIQEFEPRLKRRPSPFATKLKLSKEGSCSVPIGTNIPSLLHRALLCLPSEGCTEKPVLLWGLGTKFTPAAALNLPKFNKFTITLRFRIPLGKEQTCSLEWMIHQEDKKAEPFIEEEVSEAVLDPLGWRAGGTTPRTYSWWCSG